MALGLAWLALPGAVSTAAAAQSYAGRPLGEALRDLQERGLRILFTSQVVTPEMRVEEEPAAASPREILDELLAAHGLEARETAGGALVVVPRPPPPPRALRGWVRERSSGRPLAEVRVLLPEVGQEAVSAADGSFTLPPLAPGSYTLEARRPGFVVDRRELEVEAVESGEAVEIDIDLVPAPLSLDEIVVTPSRVSLLRSDPAAVLALERDEILALPHLGDDLFRALTLLPGTSGNELSAQFHIRGGRADEVLVMLDQLELFEPYHLKDFSDALSIIAPRAIAEVDLFLGGFPARFGDRMGGVLDMRTATPGGERRVHLGVNLLGAQAGGSGSLGGGRGRWLGVARLGTFELVSTYLSPEERPAYWDAFGKLTWQLNASQHLGARALHAGDRLSFDLMEEEDRERADTAYTSSYLWLTHQALLGSRMFVDSVVSRGHIDRDRRAVEMELAEEGRGFTLRDERALDATGFKQDWSFQPAPVAGEGEGRQYLRWGFDLRRLEADYDYRNARQLDDPLADIRSEPRTGTTEFRRHLRGEQVGLYLSDRVRLSSSLTAEAGLRYDEQTLPGDRDLSPRLNLVLALGARSTLRVAWGHYFQSQRPYELQVEDGETDFFPAERTEQYVLGFEHVFAAGSPLSSLRFDVYHRDTTNPRPRYENIYEPKTSFPEIEPDRVRVEPERSTAQGVEIFLRGRRSAKLDWWGSYTWSRAEDEIDGRDVPRGIDQPHAVSLDVSYRLNPRWTLNLAFRFHTGWPTTAIYGELEENDEGELEPVPVFGPFNGERLPDYHRLDLRLSRRWQLRQGALSLFLDIQNLYDRENIAGFNVDFDLAVEPDGRVRVIPVEEIWGGILPSFGVEWEF